MPPSNAMENDKKRLRNQFTKDERTRLLTIMTEYGPLLDDKNISIGSRKEIWEIIENKFNENGHSGRTSAQLKKYWQNYKYHSKRTKIIHKEVPRPLSPMTKQMVRMLAKVNPEEWARYDVAANAVAAKKSPALSESSSVSVPIIQRRDEPPAEGSSPTSIASTTPPRKSSSQSVVEALFPIDSRLRQEKLGVNGQITESNVVVSTTDVPGSSVTVSVICPEVPSKGRTIFWKRNMLADKICPKLEPIDTGADLGERVDRERNSADELSPNVREDLPGDTTNDSRSGKPTGNKRYRLAANESELSAIDGSDNSNEKSGRYRDVIAVDGRLVHKLPRKGPTTDETDAVTGREVVGNGVGVVEEVPGSSARLSATNGRHETTKTSMSEGVPNPLTRRRITSRENRRVAKCTGAGTGNVIDSTDCNEILGRSPTARESLKRTEILNGLGAMTEVFDKLGADRHFEEDCVEGLDGNGEVDMTRFAMNRREDSSAQDLLWFDLYLTLLRSAGQPGGGRPIEILRKIEPLISTMSFRDNESNGDDEESSDGERGMEVDERTNAGNRAAGNSRARRVASMTPAADADQAQREIKVEKEVEPEASGTVRNVANDDREDDRLMNSMNCLVQARLRSIKSGLDHRLKLQKLETEEKELRVKIAEMVIQETRLRIQALVEDGQRAAEIHELRLAQRAAEKARSEAEQRAQVDASFVATAEGRARIGSIERDRERSENVYQMQLRCMTAGAGVNGNCAVNGGKCKRYQR